MTAFALYQSGEQQRKELESSEAVQKELEALLPDAERAAQEVERLYITTALKSVRAPTPVLVYIHALIAGTTYHHPLWLYSKSM